MDSQDRMKHRRDHMGEVLHRIEHELVGFVVVAQRHLAKELSYKEVVGVPGEIVHKLVQELPEGVALDSGEALPVDPECEVETG